MALKAQYTAYHDTMRSANGTYPNENTCAAPPEIPFGTKIKVSGTGTAMDGRVYIVTDRGGAVKKIGDRYIFDLWMPSEKKCLEFGRRNGMAEVVKGNSASATVNKKKSSRKKTGGSDIIDVAASQIGYKESGENQTKYGAWYGMNGAHGAICLFHGVQTRQACLYLLSLKRHPQQKAWNGLKAGGFLNTKANINPKGVTWFILKLAGAM